MNSRRLLLVAGCMLLTFGYLRIAGSTEFVPVASGLESLPLDIDDWQGRDDGRFDRQTEDVLQADTYALRTYSRGAVPVTLFVAYYASQRTGHTTHSPLNCLPGSGWQPCSVHRSQICAMAVLSKK